MPNKIEKWCSVFQLFAKKRFSKCKNYAFQ